MARQTYPRDIAMIAGVDGCKGGWLVALADQWPAGKVQVFICQDFAGVADMTRDCHPTVVDMPIGLPDATDGSPFPRQCDLEAKRRLGKNASSVFFAPPRGSLSAETPTDFQSLHRQLTGQGAGLPVWGIVPKIREVDSIMTQELQTRIHEFHPELAWRRANKDRPLEKKKSNSGIQRRREILKPCVGNLDRLEAWISQVGRAAALDDLFDALIGLQVAFDCGSGDFHFPKTASRDPKGLEMTYRF